MKDPNSVFPLCVITIYEEAWEEGRQKTSLPRCVKTAELCNSFVHEATLYSMTISYTSNIKKINVKIISILDVTFNNRQLGKLWKFQKTIYQRWRSVLGLFIGCSAAVESVIRLIVEPTFSIRECYLMTNLSNELEEKVRQTGTGSSRRHQGTRLLPAGPSAVAAAHNNSPQTKRTNHTNWYNNRSAGQPNLNLPQRSFFFFIGCWGRARFGKSHALPLARTMLGRSDITCVGGFSKL